MKKCKDKHLYIIDTAGADLGVYDAKNKGFRVTSIYRGIASICKEYPWDVGQPYGTVKPLRKLEFVGDKTGDDLIHFINKKMISLIYEIKEMKTVINTPLIVLIDAERMKVLKSYENKFKFLLHMDRKYPDG